MNTQWKIDDRALLEYLLHRLGRNRSDLQKEYKQYYALDRAVELERRTTVSTQQWAGQPLYARDVIYNTPRAAIKATQYGRIKDVQLHRQLPPQKPTVQIKRKRNIQKP